MIRARGLKALKIEGPQLVFVQHWIDYIGCNLKCLILRYVDIKVRYYIISLFFLLF